MSGKRIAAIVVLVVLVLVVVALVVVPSPDRFDAGDGDAVAVIHLAGPIQEAGVEAFAGPAISPEVVRERLDSALAEPRVAAVILRVDSPGGTVAASQEIHDMVADFELPIVLSMADQAASGGYYIAAAADRIVAQPGTLTGSIGVIWLSLDLSELLDELGVGVEAVTAGEHKDMFLPLGLSDERRELVQDITDEMYDQFVTAVAEGRELPEEEVRRLATGEVFTGEQASKLGLVDVLGGLDVAIAEAEELAGIEDADVIDLRPGLLELIFGGPAARVGDPLDRLLRRGHVDGDDVVVQLRDLLETYSTPRYEAP